MTISASKPIAMTSERQRALRAAASGRRLTAREAKALDAAGLLIREPRTGWCLVTERGRAALRSLDD